MLFEILPLWTVVGRVEGGEENDKWYSPCQQSRDRKFKIALDLGS